MKKNKKEYISPEMETLSISMESCVMSNETINPPGGDIPWNQDPQNE